MMRDWDRRTDESAGCESTDLRSTNISPSRVTGLTVWTEIASL